VLVEVMLAKSVNNIEESVIVITIVAAVESQALRKKLCAPETNTLRVFISRRLKLLPFII